MLEVKVCGREIDNEAPLTRFAFLQETTEPMETHFLLADNVYCKASVPPTEKVCLWLGVSILSEHFISRIKPESNEVLIR